MLFETARCYRANKGRVYRFRHIKQQATRSHRCKSAIALLEQQLCVIGRQLRVFFRYRHRPGSARNAILIPGYRLGVTSACGTMKQGNKLTIPAVCRKSVMISVINMCQPDNCWRDLHVNCVVVEVSFAALPTAQAVRVFRSGKTVPGRKFFRKRTFSFCKNEKFNAIFMLPGMSADGKSCESISENDGSPAHLIFAADQPKSRACDYRHEQPPVPLQLAMLTRSKSINLSKKIGNLKFRTINNV